MNCPFRPRPVAEYLCIGENGKYAGFSYSDGEADALAGIHNTETGEITFIPEGIRVNAVGNNGFAFGVYRPDGFTDRAFIRNRKPGFMDFGDFIVAYAAEAELELLKKSTALWRALTAKTGYFFRQCRYARQLDVCPLFAVGIRRKSIYTENSATRHIPFHRAP